MNGRHVYEHVDTVGSALDDFRLWRAGNSLWQAGFKCCAGRNLAVFSVHAKDAALPTGLRGWRVVDEKGLWHEAPHLRCTGADQLDGHGSPLVHMVGAHPVAIAHVEGSFMRDAALVNGMPAYSGRDRMRHMMMWNFKGRWLIGDETDLGTDKAAAVDSLTYRNASLVPEAVSAWEVCKTDGTWIDAPALCAAWATRPCGRSC